LDPAQRVRALPSPDLTKVLAFLERKEPNNAPNNDRCDRVGDEGAVESLEPTSGSLGREDSSNGDDKGNGEDDAKAEAGIEVGRADDEVAQEVRSAPDDGKGDADAAGDEESKVEAGPDGDEGLGGHD